MISNFGSKMEWEEHCRSSSANYLKLPHFRKWIKSGKIHIIDFSGLGSSGISFLRSGLKEAIALTGKKFKIIEAKNKKNYRVFFDSCISKNTLASKKLLRKAMNDRKRRNRECADIFITKCRIKSNHDTIKDGEALTFIKEGIVMFSFDENVKYPKSFLKRRGKHEAFHLFGLNAHHEAIRVHGYRNDRPCIMRYNAPVDRICPKCHAGIQSFWSGLRDERTN